MICQLLALEHAVNTYITETSINLKQANFEKIVMPDLFMVFVMPLLLI